MSDCVAESVYFVSRVVGAVNETCHKYISLSVNRIRTRHSIKQFELRTKCMHDEIEVNLGANALIQK